LLAIANVDKTKAIILRAEEGYQKAVNVLDIANRNQIKVVLVAVKLLVLQKKDLSYMKYLETEEKKSFAITSVIFVILFVLFFYLGLTSLDPS
jgi:hypothetical protein